MPEIMKPKVLVVGGGPGGYVAAIRAGQLGLDTVLVEGDRLGGTCLIRGCIPSKAMIHAASSFHDLALHAREGGKHGIRLASPPSLDLRETVRWKEGIVGKLNSGVGALLKRAKVKVVPGWATFTDAKTCTVTGPDGTTTTITPEHVILANGSEATPLPHMPFGGPVISSTEALDLTELPQRLVVIGGGYIGLELGTAFAKFGCAVTVVEAADRILPLYDADLTSPVRRWLEKAGVTLHLSAKATGVETAGNETVVVVETAKGETLRLPADRVLVTVGRRPRTQGWGLETMGVEMDGRFVRVDDQRRTSMRNVWAIGDLNGEPMLAHKASAEGEMVAEIISGRHRRFDPAAIAAVCFTEPEIVSAGLLPSDPGGSGPEVITAIFPYAANGRALSMEAGDDGGFVRVLARRSDHRVLGLQATGANVSELSGEFAAWMEMGAVLEDIAGTIHVHPTLSEAVHEAAQKALGHAIHI